MVKVQESRVITTAGTCYRRTLWEMIEVVQL